MFLAVRELRFARARFGLMGSVVALIAVLMVLLSGLSTGLVNDGVSGLQRLPVTAFAFAEGVQRDSAFSRSEIDTRAASAWQGQDGVAEAEPFGNMLVNARNGDGVQIDLALFGVRPGSYLDPGAATGEAMAGPGETVVSSTAIDAGIAVGDTVVIDRLGTELRVVGSLSEQHTFGHVDVAYVPLRTWQEIHAGSRPGEPVPDRAYSAATAVAIAAEDGADLDLGAGDRAAGTQSMTVEESFGASPGYTAETSTLTLIQVFLYAISALVVGAFFTVWTIQRRHELAVLRAIGASTGYLLRDGLAQALILLVAATSVGVAIGVGGGSLLDGSGMPFALDPPAVLLAAVLLVTLGLLGAATAIKRITAVDPLTALGGNR
ncbi:ABC-type antimicrobial peptide transport system, permease component [Saccharomonospora marina XMU15]|uniref:ABC-type antimicrobial peptide transport system, permease component n=1 Tax=Saccharomonospora marina XMU15 TaxID=882083 RepID=H5X7W5_9PSEU|nr:ABC transporter permease [Saccharomonospora marina]EHR52465.1 ABC-type antimicrobial peptide transport system, permease component [Saccharomonospora marina XMU15]